MKARTWTIAAGVWYASMAVPLVAQDVTLPVPQQLERALSQTVATDSQFRRFDRSESISNLLQEKLTCAKLIDRSCRPKNGRPLVQSLFLERKSDSTAIAGVLVIEADGGRLMRYIFLERKSNSGEWIRVPPLNIISVPHEPR